MSPRWMDGCLGVPSRAGSSLGRLRCPPRCPVWQCQCRAGVLWQKAPCLQLPALPWALPSVAELNAAQREAGLPMWGEKGQSWAGKAPEPTASCRHTPHPAEGQTRSLESSAHHGQFWAKGHRETFAGTSSTSLHLPLLLHGSWEVPKSTARCWRSNKPPCSGGFLGQQLQDFWGRAAWGRPGALSELCHCCPALSSTGCLSRASCWRCLGAEERLGVSEDRAAVGRAGLARSQPRI